VILQGGLTPREIYSREDAEKTLNCAREAVKGAQAILRELGVRIR